MEGRFSYPPVSVLLPAGDDADGLDVAIAAIQEQEYPGSIEIVVADGSTYCTVAQLVRRRYPTVRFVSNPDHTTSAGINRALAASTGDIVMRCDTQAKFPPGYIQDCVEMLKRTGAGNVGGKQHAVGTSFFERAVALGQRIPLGVGNACHRLDGVEGPADTVYLGVYRRQVLEAVGGFDPRLLRNQDYALNWNLRRRGETVWYDPKIKVTYRPRRSLRKLARQYLDYGRWKCVVVWRYPRSICARHLAAPLLTLGLIASAVGAWGSATLLASVLPLTYLLTLLGEALRAGIRYREPAAVLLPLTLAVMHLCWGIGFLCPPREIWKKRTSPLRHPSLEESMARPWKSSFPEHKGGGPVSPMIRQANARGQQSAVANGAASVAEARQAVSAIILTWNSVGKIEPCLESLGQGTQVPDEIIVVDNDSTDQTRAVLAEQFPSVRVIENPHNRGVARARNQALAVARGAYLLVLDDDTVVHMDALARLVSVLDTDPTVGVSGPQLLNSACQLMDRDQSFPTLWHKARRWRGTNLQNGRSSGNATSGGLQDVDYIIGACHIVRRAALDEVGPYDEHIFYGPEDIDFCLRLHQAGWRVVREPAAQVIHAEQRIARSVWSAMGRKHVTGLVYYFWKHRYGSSRKRLYTHLSTNSPASCSH